MASKVKDSSAISPEGTKYWFDWLVFSDPATTSLTPVREPDGLDPWLSRAETIRTTEASLMVTKVEDAYGNYISYEYTGKKLTRISASDGRRVDFKWIDHPWGGRTHFPEFNAETVGYIESITTQAQSTKPRTWHTHVRVGIQRRHLEARRAPEESDASRRIVLAIQFG